MRATEQFTKTIKTYLDERAKNDELFAISYAKANKSIDECITYIINQVQQSGCNGFADEEIYSMAVHYYDEDSVMPGPSVDCKVVINHSVELTEEEKAQAKSDLIKRLQDDIYERMKAQSKEPKKRVEEVIVPSLF